MEYKVSVIIAVYCAEKYIKRCAESLFAQTLDNIEYIFVNDCTPDRSIEILKEVMEKYPQRKSDVRIIETDHNSKQAHVRNLGLALASGKYIIHCDPDDWVEQSLYEDMYTMACENNLDIVSCDYVIEKSSSEASSIHHLPLTDSPLQVLMSEKFYLMCLWNHLIRRDIIVDNDIVFYDGINYSEDVAFVSRAMAVSATIGHIGNAYYHYNKTNELSISHNCEDPDIIRQRIESLKQIDVFMKSRSIDIAQLSLLLRYKRDVKNLFMKKESLGYWVKLFPEVCPWEIRQPGASLLYRVAYFLSHKVGTWPMRLLLSVR